MNVHRVGWNSFTFFDIWRVSLPVGLLIALATVNVAWLNEHAHNFFIALRERMHKQKCEANKAGANKHATSYVVGCIEFCHTIIVAARAKDSIFMLNVELGVAPYNGYDFRSISNNAAQALEALDPRIEPNWIITDYELQGRCTNEGVGCIVFYNLPYSKAADEGFTGVLYQGPPMKDGKPSTAARPIEILKKGVLGWVYKVAEECADPCKPPLLWKNADFVAPALPIGHSSENTQTGYLTFPAGVPEIARLYADRPFVSTAINPEITSTSDSNSDGHEVHPPLPPSTSTPPVAAAAAAVISSTPERDVGAVAVLHPVIASPVLSPVSEPSEMDIDEEEEEEEDKNKMNEDRPSKRRREYDPAQHFCGSGPCRFPDCPYYKQTTQQSESIVAVTATITATETNENTNIDDKDEEEGARLWRQGINESDMNTIGGALALLDQEAQDQEVHGLEQALQGGSPVGRPGTPHPSLTPPFDFPTINSDREIDPGTGLFLDELPLGPGWRTPLRQVQPGWQVSNHRGGCTCRLFRGSASVLWTNSTRL
uniref:Uncharacterized protein n=1 Tax=Chromera velia CCMP2878 TaxID=1169474 RepID=A0A0G4FFT2_9ALVE|eukprot:Cvel_16758.t1-p1 / transcript=Cvel_16758.t1 / gene=Cvel_16758 / organism=Chromera_velia_CCMP2878 / gene_product=hypothetical protein / transcript_product=hypothetical protein / location=Cvel_scaffold1306:46517-48139(-) / protein_length=541 / sequence_SO=supercontig / SO=protein_coding / is_pseudo=false